MNMSRVWVVGCLLWAGVAVGCTQVAAPENKPQGSAPASQAAAQSPRPAATDAVVAAVPTSAADLFPPGPARALALDNCATCHNLACATIGQRPNARWDSLKKSHAEKVSGLSDADLNAVFEYLKTNFNDSKPEPKVPPKFLEGGCTPF